MKIEHTRRYLLVVRALLIILFAYAATIKGFQFEKFAVQLSSSPLIPISLVRFTAIGVPAVEIIIAILLVLDTGFIWGLWLAYSVMLFFTLYILYILNVPEFVPCACGDILGTMSHQTHLIFNFSVTLVILAGLYFYYRMPKTTPVK